MKRTLFGLYFFSTLSAPAGLFVFSDAVMSSNRWSAQLIEQTGPPPSFAVEDRNSGGNPDTYRHILENYGGPGTIITGHLLDGATFDPAAGGALSNLTFSMDLQVFSLNDSEGIRYAGLVFQNDSYYMNFDIIGDSQYVTNIGFWQGRTYTNLVATDFSRIFGSGPLRPDFSAAGDLIQFGYYVANGTFIHAPTFSESGIDNFSVSFEADAIPEPATAGFFLAGPGGWLIYRRRRR
ncbi:MAG: PEP-CTERM sorting domain-containing protein [Verrucomicrobiota bacterium]